MGNAIWGFHKYAREVFDSRKLDIDCFVRDGYSEKGSEYGGCPVYEEDSFFEHAKNMRIFIADFYHYRQISEELSRRGYKEGRDYFGTFEYLYLDGRFEKRAAKPRAWKDREAFLSVWRERIDQMASFLEECDEKILDVGCGEEYLGRALRGQGKQYYSCDYKKRSGHTIVCDFDRQQFPKLIPDAAFVSGCLEYIENAKWLIKKCASARNKVIISYLSLEYMPNLARRRAMGYKNHYSIRQFIELFEDNGFWLADSSRSFAGDMIFVFRPYRAERSSYGSIDGAFGK